MRSVQSGGAEIELETGLKITHGTSSFCDSAIIFRGIDTRESTNFVLTKDELCNLIGQRVDDMEVFLNLLVNKYYT